MTLSSIKLKHQALLAWWVNSIFDNKAIPNTFLLILKSDENKSVVICFLEHKKFKQQKYPKKVNEARSLLMLVTNTTEKKTLL